MKAYIFWPICVALGAAPAALPSLLFAGISVEALMAVVFGSLFVAAIVGGIIFERSRKG